MGGSGARVSYGVRGTRATTGLQPTPSRERPQHHGRTQKARANALGYNKMVISK